LVLGRSFGGFALTYADTTAAEKALLAYGTCKAPGGGFGSEGGCSPPLELVSCKGSDTVIIFPRGELTRRAANALRPLNDAARRVGKPHVQVDYGSC
jgi:hypothetical protein